jgi:hypothetical protein
MALTRLWAGIRTRGEEDNGTDSRIVLIINNNINDNGSVDLLHHTFKADTGLQQDLEDGHANLYEVPLPEPLNITYTVPTDPKPYIRVAIRGEDGWAPEDFLVFGEENASPIPMALAKDISEHLRTGEPIGDPISIPIPPIRKGGPAETITRLLVLMLTSEDGGTTNPGAEVRLLIKAPTIVALFEMPPPLPEGAKQLHQKDGQANFYYTKVLEDFTKNDIPQNNSIELSLTGQASESWLPKSFFLFGIVDRGDVPQALVPLVYIPDWADTQFGPLVQNDTKFLQLTP